MKRAKIQWRPLVLSLIISLGVGGLSALLTHGSMEIYKKLNSPVLAPPPKVFPIVWTLLFILMGISAYLIFTSRADRKRKANALFLYVLQLVINFFWPIIFFNLKMYFPAFLWIILLWLTVVFMFAAFLKIRPAAAYLQIPYILWLSFAAYLNLAIYFLNR